MTPGVPGPTGPGAAGMVSAHMSSSASHNPGVGPTGQGPAPHPSHPSHPSHAGGGGGSGAHPVSHLKATTAAAAANSVSAVGTVNTASHVQSGANAASAANLEAGSIGVGSGAASTLSSKPHHRRRHAERRAAKRSFWGNMVNGFRRVTAQAQSIKRRRLNLQWRCFLLTYGAHAAIFMLRKLLSTIKPDLMRAAGWSVSYLSILDVALLLPLAVGQIVLPQRVYRHGPRLLIAVALAGAAITIGLMSLTVSYGYYLVLLTLSGGCQAMLMPFCVQALSKWHHGDKEDLQFGVWGSSTFVGLLSGALLAHVLRSTLGWQHIFTVPSIMALVLSLLVFRLLRMPSGIRGAQTPPLPSHYRSSSPPPTAPPHHHHHLHHHRGSPRSSHSGNSQVVLSRNEGYVAVDPGSASNTDTESDIETEVVVMEPLAPLEINNIADVLRLPHIHELALAYMCLNALRFALHMWLPLYFEQQLGFSAVQAGYFSSFYEFGGLVGSIVLGHLAQTMFRGRRVLACHFALALSAVATLLLYLTQQWIVLACFFLIIMGGGSGGTDVILSTSMAIDLGREANCITLVAGYIGGMGALGAMLQAPVVSLCLYLGGKSGVLWAMILLTVAASASVSRARALDTKRSLSVSQLSAKAAQ